jgi:hypothetical protein
MTDRGALSIRIDRRKAGESSAAVALAKLENYTNEEIARWLNRSLATVQRKLGLIRKLW